MRRRTTNIIRGLAALVLLVGLLVGVPWALVTQVGWPLPTAVPSWEQFSRALTRGDLDDWTIIKALAVLVWLAWAQVTANVIAEAVAVTRRRPTRRVRGAAPLRALATNLVASVAVLVSTLGRPSVTPDAGVPHLQMALATTTIDASAVAPPPPGGSSPDRHHALSGVVDSEELPGSRPRWTVRHRDTLWDIAEQTLGDGLRWREIHRLNAGRLQPDGGTLGDDGLIQAGWVLVLPDDAATDDAAAATGKPDLGPDEHEQEDVVVVEQGDTLWDLSGDHLGDPLRWQELYEENRGQPQPDGRRLDDPDTIQPGWILDVPQEEEARDVDDRDASGADEADVTEHGPSDIPPPPPTQDAPRPDWSASGGTAAEHRERQASDAVGEAPAPAEQSDVGAVPAQVTVVAGVALAAAGAAAALDRIRRARRRRRRPGDRIPLPDGSEAETELHIRGLADAADVDRIDTALRSMASARLAAGHELPPIVLVSVAPHEVALHLARPDDRPPDGWAVEDAGLTWLLVEAPSRETSESETPTETAGPMLVTLGTAADGARRVMLNLGHVGRLSLDSPAEVRRRLLLTMALELATTQRAHAMDVVVHGVAGQLSSLERIKAVESDAEATHVIQQAIANEDDPAAVVTAVLSMDRLELSDDVGAGGNVAVVSAEDDGAGWSLRAEEEGLLHLTPAGLKVQPLELTPEELEVVGELVLQGKKAPTRPPVADDIAWLDGEGETPTQPELIALDFDVDDVEVKPIEVRVLGPIEVEGAVDLTSAKAEELIVYLATHRKGATIDQLQEALWPEEEPSPGRLHTTVWRARQSLGDGPDGESLLPKVTKGRYWISQEVGLDHDRFRAHVERARLAPASALEELRAALELVRGEPYTGTATEYMWASLDAHSIAQEISDAAHWLAQLHLDAEQPAEARWAAEQGLRADPYLEALYRDLMEAAAAESNLAEVEVIMKRLRRLVAEDADDNDADDRLDPETVRCYESLTASIGGRGPAGVPR